MSNLGDFSEIILSWARREQSVQALVLFGSQARGESDHIWAADAQADWDFHIITTSPTMFGNSTWLRQATNISLRAYAQRTPRLGAMPKINAVLSGIEADFVIFPSHVMRIAKFAINIGLHRHMGRIRRNLQDLSIVIRPGYRFLKGAEKWGEFYQKVVAEVPDQRLNDVDIVNLAECFVCDYVWAVRKLERGEYLTVQRILHRELAETNFRILHEVKLRRGERTFPDARRLERIATIEERSDVSVIASPQKLPLELALSRSAITLRKYTQILLGNEWRWPNEKPTP